MSSVVHDQATDSRVRVAGHSVQRTFRP